jgi:hypothetical protein
MCFYTKCDGRLGGVNATINLFRPLDSIRLVIETMGGGGNVTINRVEGRHGREEGGEEWRHNNYYLEAQGSECDEVTWWGKCNNQPPSTSIRFDWQSRRCEEEKHGNQMDWRWMKRRYKSIQQSTFTDETINSFFSNYTTISLHSTNLNLITKLKLKYLNDSKQQHILVCTIYLTESNTS